MWVQGCRSNKNLTCWKSSLVFMKDYFKPSNLFKPKLFNILGWNVKNESFVNIGMLELTYRS